MFQWFIDRQNIKLEAQQEIESLGREAAYQKYFAASRDMTLSESKRVHAMKIRRAIERELGIKIQSDTATRYFEK